MPLLVPVWRVDALIPVDVLRTVRTPECNGCFTCVSVCPVDGALEMRTLAGRRKISALQVAAGVIALFVVVAGVARMTGHWQSDIAEAIFFDLIPRVDGLSHPR